MFGFGQSLKSDLMTHRSRDGGDANLSTTYTMGFGGWGGAGGRRGVQVGTRRYELKPPPCAVVATMSTVIHLGQASGFLTQECFPVCAQSPALQPSWRFSELPDNL